MTHELAWENVLAGEKELPYFQSILDYLKDRRSKGKVIYPPPAEVFNALKLTPYEKVKVVILGQDPYHGHHQAHGLSFSVKPGVKPPPSLENIFTELESDLGSKKPNHGCLKYWAEQGVLLLNAVLTVEAHSPQSHAQIGWQNFTDRVIKSLNQHPKGIVFLLWGSFAQKKAELIDKTKHQVLMAPHPSPFSVHRGFFGCKHFSKANELLKEMGREPIDWQLPEEQSNA